MFSQPGNQQTLSQLVQHKRQVSVLYEGLADRLDQASPGRGRQSAAVVTQAD